MKSAKHSLRQIRFFLLAQVATAVALQDGHDKCHRLSLVSRLEQWPPLNPSECAVGPQLWSQVERYWNVLHWLFLSENARNCTAGEHVTSDLVQT